jgi:hypothetical protein
MDSCTVNTANDVFFLCLRTDRLYEKQKRDLAVLCVHLTKYYHDDEIEENEMGGACSTHGRD